MSNKENKNNIKFMDLFAGCGGLMDGFMQSGKYDHVAAVEWEKSPVDTLINRLKTKWGYQDADCTVLRFDMQREDELFKGYDDPYYGKSVGLDEIVKNKGGIDIIIGGPPCQAYSVAGRNAGRMEDDYRNYLFEHYVATVKRYDPKLFVFENVPGMLTAKPGGKPVTEMIKNGFEEIGFEIIDDMKSFARIDMADFGIPQSRKRVILLGLNRKYFSDCQNILRDFYQNILSSYKTENKNLEEAIGDLPRLLPLDKPLRINGRNQSHTPECLTDISWHVPRYSNERDIKVFKILEKDIEDGTNKYQSTDELIKLYEKTTGKKTKVHKYHVLRKNEPSTTILAHLYKDGFRFIHYDSRQARTITVREAARIQTFADDFDFIGSMGAAYKMIGNAVPSEFARLLSLAIQDFLNKYLEGDE